MRTSQPLPGCNPIGNSYIEAQYFLRPLGRVPYTLCRATGTHETHTGTTGARPFPACNDHVLCTMFRVRNIIVSLPVDLCLPECDSLVSTLGSA